MVNDHADRSGAPMGEHDHAHDIYTVANIITLLRLMLVPLFFAVLITAKHDVLAFTLFVVAASTDWIDGQIARRTGTVTEIGKAIDPLVDRLLIASGVIGLYVEGRLPSWILVTLLVRDAYLLAGAGYLARHRLGTIPVIYLGKATTMVLLAGFSGMILNWPQAPGLGLVEEPMLVGLGSSSAAIWIWLIYAGIIMSLTTAVIYTIQAAERINSRAG